MKQIKIIFLGLCLFSTITNIASADERFEKPAFWLNQGYQSQTRLKNPFVNEQPIWGAHNLRWPVAFENAQNSMGNSMHEFQEYGVDGPYYHGGCDLRVARKAPVHSPVSGRIEAGHYGYSNNPDGSDEKFWKPWPATGSQYYFEIAVITDDNYRFEFHHMDETNMAPEVLKILKNGGQGRIEAGALLGTTVAWPDGVYHHAHYNIITPSGIKLNPEYYSTLIPDTIAPQVSKVLAVMSSGQTLDFGDGRFTQSPKFFAVAVIDRKDNNIYDQPPTFAGIIFEDGKSFAWDFNERLFGENGVFPPIWDFYIKSIKAPNGQALKTYGGYGKGLSVIRINVPENAKGKFNLKVADIAGNETTFAGIIE
ncbi:MAG: hypothetical protein V4736_05540 [Bdellovibrionota bacterium]